MEGEHAKDCIALSEFKGNNLGIPRALFPKSEPK